MPKFPFTNYHELNLDWILKKVSALFDASEENARTIRTYDSRLTSAEHTATSAATAATSAQQLADAAAANADNALSVAGTADSKADSALTAATDASSAVSGALTIAQEAQQTAGAAVATANDAAATASGLESLANTANQNATAAVETAGTAVTKANNAAAAAQTADQKAVAAQQSAESAQDATATNAVNISTLQTNVTDLNRQISESIEEIETALDGKAPAIYETVSGEIASFADGADGMLVKSLIANIEPVQDLHGYDYPWPAGGGKNLLDFRTKAGGSDNGVTYTNNDGVITVNGRSTGYSWYQSPSFTLPAGTYLVNGKPSGAVSYLYVYNISTNQSIVNVQPGKDFTMTLSEATTVAARVIVSQGNTANNEVFKPMIRLATETDATFAPYSNICPISGHTGAEIEQRGRNLFNSTAMRYSQGGGLTIATENTKLNGVDAVKYTITGTNTGWGWRVIVDGIKNAIKPDTDYCMSYVMDGHALTNMNISQASGASSLIQTSRAATTRTLPNGLIQVSVPFHTKPADDSAWASGGIVLLLYSVEAIQGAAVTFTLTKPQLSFGLEVPDSVDQYQGNQISITFPSEVGTVYGGTLDVTNGVLTVTMAEADLGELTWFASSSTTNCFYATVPQPYYRASRNVEMLCSLYKYGGTRGIGPYFGDDGVITAFYNGISGAREVYVHDNRYTTASEFQAAMSGVQLIYELDNPTTYQLTPQELATILGTNNIWTDVGTVDVEYPADTKLYIDGKIAELQALVLEN